MLKRLIKLIILSSIILSCSKVLDINNNNFVLKNINKLDFLNDNVTLITKGNTLYGKSFINSYRSEYMTKRKNKISIKDIASTKIGGNIKYLQLEAKYFSLLKNTMKYNYDENNFLVFTTKDNNKLVFVNKVTSDILDGKKFINDDIYKYTMSFSKSNIGGKIEVNRYNSKYIIKNNKIRVSPDISITVMNATSEELQREISFLRTLGDFEYIINYSNGYLHFVDMNTNKTILKFKEVK